MAQGFFFAFVAFFAGFFLGACCDIAEGGLPPVAIISMACLNVMSNLSGRVLVTGSTPCA